MTEQQAQQNNFEGWAILEIFGHQKYAGFVSTQTFGTAVMFRVDVPALEARERIADRPHYAGGRGFGEFGAYAPLGAVIKEGPVQGYTKLFGVGAIYTMTPCSRDAALAVVEEIHPRPLMEVQIPTEAKALTAGSDHESAPQTPYDDDDDPDYIEDDDPDEDED